MSIFSFNGEEKNVVTATAKLSAISMIVGLGMALGSYGVLHLGEKLDDKRNLERERDTLKEQLDNQKDLTEKYKSMFHSEQCSGSETYKKLLQLQIENRRLEEKLNSMKSKTEGLGD